VRVHPAPARTGRRWGSGACQVTAALCLRGRVSSTRPTGDAYKFLFMAKGGGSANKSYLYQETKAVLNPTRMASFLEKKIRTIGTSACPPCHLATVVGGTSAEYTLKTAKYAPARYLDTLPTVGSEINEAVLKCHSPFTFRPFSCWSDMVRRQPFILIGRRNHGSIMCGRRGVRGTVAG
jgi:hypothetical protein